MADIPGYLQAVGTLITVGVGAWMVVWQQRKASGLVRAASEGQTHDKAARRIALGYRLDLLVDDIKSHHAMAASSLTLFDAGLTLISQGEHRLDDAIKVMEIDVSWSDSLFTDMGIMPRDIQESTTTLLYLVSNYNRETEKTLRHGCKHRVHTVGDLPAESAKALASIKYRMDVASGLLEMLLDGKRSSA